MKIEGKSITIEKLKLEDVYQMRYWGFHKNPLIEDYNFPQMSDDEIKLWYRRKTNTISNKYYSIKNKDGNLIGYMGIKEIKRIDPSFEDVFVNLIKAETQDSSLHLPFQ